MATEKYYDYWPTGTDIVQADIAGGRRQLIERSFVSLLGVL